MTAAPPPNPSPHAATAPAGGPRRVAGAPLVLVLAVLLLLGIPVARFLPILIATLGIGVHGVSSAVATIVWVLTIALYAALLHWIRAGREGERLALLPMLSFGAMVAAELLGAVVDVARLLIFITPSGDVDGIVTALGALSALIDVVAALVVAALAVVALVRRRHEPRRARIPLPLRSLVLLLLPLVVLLCLTLVSTDAWALLSLPGGDLPPGPQPLLMGLGSLLYGAVLVISAPVIVRTEARDHLLAWAVPAVMWCGGLVRSVVNQVTSVFFLSTPDDLLAVRRIEFGITMAVDLLTGGVMVAIVIVLLVRVLRRRAGSPAASSLAPAQGSGPARP